MSVRTAREVREQSGGEQRKEVRPMEKNEEKKKDYFNSKSKVVLHLYSDYSPIEYSPLTSSHFTEFGNPLTSSIMKLS